jgi:hypothetical protein
MKSEYTYSPAEYTDVPPRRVGVPIQSETSPSIVFTDGVTGAAGTVVM